MHSKTSWTFQILFLTYLIQFRSECHDYLCEACKCENTTPFVIDCSDQGMNQMLQDGEWPKNVTSIDARFDNNNFEIVDRFTNLPIVSLSFENNKISTLSNKVFANLTSLLYLDLSFNRLDYK